MSKKLLSTLIASLFVAAPAFAQSDDDPMRVQGTATLGGLYNNTSARDTAKLFEYQDLGNGALSNVGVQGRNSRTWFQGYGENFGRTDQYMFLRGGMYDVFKAGAYLNDIPHTFSSTAYTPFAGSGSNVLTATFPLAALPTNPPTALSGTASGWATTGATRAALREWQKNSPWYFRVDGNQVTFSGTKVGSGANGTSPGNGYIDLAIPQEFKTSNWGVEGGYQTSKATFAMRWDYSKFENDNATLLWTNPYFGPTSSTTSNLYDTTYLAPDNKFNKFTVSGNYRDMPWRSVISARYTWAKTTSDFPLGPTALNSGACLPTRSRARATTTARTSTSRSRSRGPRHRSLPSTRASTTTGRSCRTTPTWSSSATRRPRRSRAASAAATWSWAAFLRTTVGNCENELYNYTKNNVGFDAWWRFARGQRFGFGWDYNNLDQTRVDYDKAHWNKLWAEYKNTMFDTVSGRLKYQYIKRDADLNFTNDPLPNGGANNPNYLLPFTSAFDLQSNTTNLFKLYLDWVPTVKRACRSKARGRTSTTTTSPMDAPATTSRATS